MFQPRGRHEILKCSRQVCIPPLPTLPAMLISNVVPLSGLPMWFPWRECAHFLLGRQNIPRSVRCLGHIVMLVPSSLNCPMWARIKPFSVRILVCDWLKYYRMSVFYKRSREIFRDPQGNVRDILHFSFENAVTNEQKSETMLTFPMCEHL